jgi:hypothetical protein
VRITCSRRSRGWEKRDREAEDAHQVKVGLVVSQKKRWARFPEG